MGTLANSLFQTLMGWIRTHCSEIWKTASSASHEPPLPRVQATAVAAKLRKQLSAQQRQGPHPRRSRYEGRGGGVGLLSALGVPPGAAHSGEVFVSLP